MKTISKYILLFFSMATLLTSCESEVSLLDDLEALGFQGTEQDIIAFLSEDAYNGLLDLGITINKGNTPPVTGGTYLMSPYVLQASNIPDESFPVGHVFADYAVSIYGQDSEHSISFQSFHVYNDGSTGQYTNSEIARISGSGSRFTIIAKAIVTDQDSYGNVVTIETGYVFSGRVASYGIEDMQNAIIVISKQGDSYGEFIDVGEGRFFVDEDGISYSY